MTNVFVGLVAFSLNAVPAHSEQKGPHAGYQWRQVLQRASRLSTLKSVTVYVEEIPIDDWLDPELHRVLRDFNKQWFASMAFDSLEKRLEWAFSRNPELIKIWLPEGDLEASKQVLSWFFSHEANPFVATTDVHYRDVARRIYSDKQRVSEFLDWIKKGDVDVLSPMRAPSKADWDALDRICREDAKARDRIRAALANFSKKNESSERLGIATLNLPSLRLISRRRFSKAQAEVIADELKQKKSSAAMIDSAFGDNVALSLSELHEPLRARAYELGLKEWLKRVDTKFLASPLAEDWISALSEDWVTAQISDPAFAESAGLGGEFVNKKSKFLRLYGRKHPLLRRLISDRCRTYDFLGDFESNPKPAIKPAPFSVPEITGERPRRRSDAENEGRLAFSTDEMIYRGINDVLVVPDARVYDAAERGRAFLVDAFKRGLVVLQKRKLEFNPLNWLTPSLENLFQAQSRQLPRTRSLKPHEIELRVSEALAGLPEDKSDPRYTRLRDHYEAELRSRLNFEEVDYAANAQNSLGAMVDPLKFAVWRIHSLKRLEGDLRKYLLNLLAQLGPHGISLKVTLKNNDSKVLTAHDIERVSINEHGEFALDSGDAIELDLSSAYRSSRELIVGPARLASSDELAERTALSSSFNAFLENYQNAAQSLLRNGIRPNLLLNHYRQNRSAHEARFDANSTITPLDGYLWSRVRERPNFWKDLQLHAILNNQPVRPLVNRTGKTAATLLMMSLLAFKGADSVIKSLFDPSGVTSRSVGGAKGDGGQFEKPNSRDLNNPGKPSSREHHLLTYHGGAALRKEERPKFYSMGYSEEFQSASIVRINSDSKAEAQASYSKPAGYPIVSVSSDAFGSLIPLVRPEGAVLGGVRAYRHPSIFQQNPLIEGEDYVVVLDPRTHDLALRMRKPHKDGYFISLDYFTAPADSFEAQEARNLGDARSFDPVLDRARLRVAIKQLEQAGFDVLSKAMRTHLEQNQNRMKSSELRDLVAARNRYSYRQIRSPIRATIAEWDQNPFLPYSAALNEDGVFCAVCEGHNLLETELINRALGPESPFHAEVRTSFANQNLDNTLTSDEAHARTYIFRTARPGEPALRLQDAAPIVLDSTAFTYDGKNAPRTAHLPDHGSTPSRRHEDFQLYMKLFYLTHRNRSGLLGDFVKKLARKVDASEGRPETELERLQRIWLTRLAQAEEGGAQHPLGVLRPEDAFSIAKPIYEARLSIDRMKTEILTYGNELRSRHSLKKLKPSDPIVRATMLATQLTKLIEESPDLAVAEPRIRELTLEVSWAKSHVKNLILMNEISEIREAARKQGKRPEFTAEQLEMLRKRQHFSSAHAPPLPESLADKKMSELLERELAEIEQAMAALTPKGVEALRQVRLYQFEQYQAGIVGMVPPAGASAGGCVGIRIGNVLRK